MREAVHDSRAASRAGLRSIMLWALLLSLTAGVQAARKSGSRKSRDVSFSSMLREMEESESHLMELDDDSFNDFLIKPGASRDFPVLVMFNARDPKLGCRACQENGAALSVVATSYLGQRSPKVEQQPMIFAILDFQQGQKTFGKMELQTVPRMFLFKANESVKIPPVDEQQFLLQPPEVFSTLIGVVRERTGVVINLVPDVQATVIIGALAALLIAIASYLVTDQTRWLLSLPHKRSLWFLVSISVYGFGVGGMVYCIIRRSPLYSWGQKEIQLFAIHTNQDQYILEGMVVGLWNIMTGLSFAMAVVLGSGKRNRLVQFVGVHLFLALGFYFLQKVMLTYETKTRWYNIQGTLPKPVSDFLFASIKKSTGLLRRLLRLSQLWLWNYKDWATFKAKHLHSYMFKYVQREYGHVLEKIGIQPEMLGLSN